MSIKSMEDYQGSDEWSLLIEHTQFNKLIKGSLTSVKTVSPCALYELDDHRIDSITDIDIIYIIDAEEEFSLSLGNLAHNIKRMRLRADDTGHGDPGCSFKESMMPSADKFWTIPSLTSFTFVAPRLAEYLLDKEENSFLSENDEQAVHFFKTIQRCMPLLTDLNLVAWGGYCLPDQEFPVSAILDYLQEQAHMITSFGLQIAYNRQRLDPQLFEYLFQCESGSDDIILFNRIDRFDTQTNTSVHIGRFNKSIQSPSVAYHKNNLYIVGGMVEEIVVGCLVTVSVAEYSITVYAYLDVDKNGLFIAPTDTYLSTHLTLSRPEDPKFVPRDLVTPDSINKSGMIVDGLSVGTYCLTPVTPVIPQGPIMIGPKSNNNHFDASNPTLCLTFTPKVKLFAINLAWRRPDFLIVGGKTWFDTDENGMYVAGEPFISVTVNLLKEDKVTVIATTTTNTTVGTYQFNTTPGKYCVQIISDPSVVPTKIGQNIFPPNGIYCFTGGLDKTLDFPAGFKAAPKYDVQGYTWMDADNNGVRSPSTDPYYGPIAMVYEVHGFTWNDQNSNGAFETTESFNGPVTVTLYKADKTSIISNSTSPASSTGYTFKVPAGSYCIKMISGTSTFVPTTIGADTKIGSDGNIHGVTWTDLNGNGVHDASEGPYPKVLVSLLKIVVIDSVITPASDGSYSFNAPPGDYCLKMQPDRFSKNTILGPDNKIPPEGFHCFTVANKEVVVDAGFIELAYFIQGVTYLDKDCNGLLNCTTDPYIGNVVVTLYQSDKTTVVATTTSKATQEGYKLKVNPGDYCIHMASNETMRPTNIGCNNHLDQDGFYCFC
eukprot:gene4054-4709_t